jgi:hypothetical protein
MGCVVYLECPVHSQQPPCSFDLVLPMSILSQGVVVLFISLKLLLLEILVHISSITVVSFDGIAYGVLHDLCNIG